MRNLREEIEEEFASLQSASKEPKVEIISGDVPERRRGKSNSPFIDWLPGGDRAKIRAYYSSKKDVIGFAMRKYGNIASAARALDLSRTTVYRWLKKNNIKPESKWSRSLDENGVPR